jgi:hypothetical protein
MDFQNRTEVFVAVSYLAMQQYAEAEPTEEREIWAEFASKLEDFYIMNDGLTRDNLLELGEILNPDMRGDESELDAFSGVLTGLLEGYRQTIKSFGS